MATDTGSDIAINESMSEPAACPSVDRAADERRGPVSYIRRRRARELRDIRGARYR